VLAASLEASVGSWQEFERGGGRNVVRVDNDHDGRFRARGNAELDRIRGDDVSPANIAEAHAQCTDCQTIAVAVQVAVYRRGAPVIAPVNRAVALNIECTRCVTVARAIQYVIPVDDFREVPREVNELVRRVDREANYFEHIKDLDKMDPREAEGRLNQLVADFALLQQYLNDMIDRREDSTSPTPSPPPSPSPSTTAGAVTPTVVSSTSTPAPSLTSVPVLPVSSPTARP
jgi:putative peptide zinc metalloprotease protein